MADYDVIVIGAGPGGIFSAYELVKANRGLKVAVFELGRPLDKRRCPIDGKKIKSCVKCNICNIMSGFGGAGAFSDGKYNITNQFGGTLYEHVGKQEAIDLMMYVDEINRTHGGEGTKLYSTANTGIKRMCLENGLHLLDAQVRHLGTDINYVVLENIYNELKDSVDFHFESAVTGVAKVEGGYEVQLGDESYTCTDCIISVGRSGSKWMESVCSYAWISRPSPTASTSACASNCPAEIFSHLTDELYESKIVYRTEKYRGSGAHVLHEPARRRRQREHQRHRHRQRPQL